MSTERPAKGVLVFMCDVCWDPHEFSKANGDDVKDFRACWAVLHEDGWIMKDSEHLCPDCAATSKADRANPFRR